MNRSDENKQKVVTSAIIAKAILRRNGRYEFIIVFQESTRHEFYWIFQAKNKRSPSRAWKYAGHYGRDFSMDVKPYQDFGSFVDYYTRIKDAEVLTVRMRQTRRLAAMRTKVEHESIQTDWTPQDKTRMTFDKVEKVNKAKFHPEYWWR